MNNAKLPFILLFIAFIIFIIMIKCDDKTQTENMIKVTKDLIYYDTVGYFQFHNHELQIKFTNGKIYYLSPLCNKNGYVYSELNIDSMDKKYGIRVGDVIYKDSNSNVVELIRNSSTFEYVIWADETNKKWKAKKLINENVFDNLKK